MSYLYLAYLSKPAAERALYRAIHRRRVHSIVEIGMATAQRATRMVAVARRHFHDSPVRYTGIDLFESRDGIDHPGLSLKEAHRRLTATGARVRLVPGDPHSALARAANMLAGTDLLLISGDQDPQSLAAAWFYVPRMLHAGSLVYIEEAAGDQGQTRWRPMTLLEVQRLATPPARHKRAA